MTSDDRSVRIGHRRNVRGPRRSADVGGAATLAAVTALVVVAAAGCGADRRVDVPAVASPVAPAPGTLTAGGPAVQFYPAGRRSMPKPVTGELLDGGFLDLASLRGTVVVINWWGSWCAPCRRETPELVQAYHATRPLGVDFVGVDVRDSREAATSFARNHQVPYRSLFDPAGRVALAFAQVPPTVVPTTVVLDRSGRVAVAFRKVVEKEELESAVRRVAADPPPTPGG
jgi:peroxiredoxin